MLSESARPRTARPPQVSTITIATITDTRPAARTRRPPHDGPKSVPRPVDRTSLRRGFPPPAAAGPAPAPPKSSGSYHAPGGGGGLQGCPRGVSRPRWAPAFEQRRSRPGCVRHAAPFRSTCGTSLREARLERETRNSRGRTARLPRRSGHDRAGSLKSGVSRLPGTAPARRPPDRLGGRAAREPLPSGTASTRIRGAGRRTRGPRIRPGGVAPPPGGP